MIRQNAVWTALATAAVAVTACDSAADKGNTPPPITPTSQTTSPTPSTTPTDPAQAAVAGAKAGYRRFIAAVDTTAASGGRSIEGLSKVATGTMLASELNQAATFRGRKWHSVGKQQVIWTKAQKVGTPNAKGVVSEVTVQACLDTSRATAVDASGKSIKAPGTPTRWIDDMTMRQVDGAWKAERAESRVGAKC